MANQLFLPVLLVVSDNPSIRYWIKKHLDEQFFILQARDRKEAIEAIKNSPLDFIILDSAIEDPPALELCKEIRRLVPDPLLPILLITGRLNKSFRDRALDAGITDFLDEQMDLEAMETRIATRRKALSARERTSELSSAIKVPKHEISKAYFKNKILLHDQALRLLAQAKKEKKSVLLMVLRIDEFEDLQSREGYLFADEILPLFLDYLHRHLRESDFLIPSSDGRFIVLMPDLSIDEGKNLAEQLRKEVQGNLFETKNGSISLTVSIVLSSLEATEIAFNRMIEGAVKALKQAQTATNQIISLDKENL